MGDITKGQTFTDGSSVNAAMLHALVESATINASFVSDKTALSSPDNADVFPIYDDSASQIKKISYSSLNTALSSGLSLASARKAVAQGSHGFAVGDVIERAAAGYAKAKAAADSHTFGTGDINTTTNRITITGHSITNGEVVLLKSSGTLPAPVVTGARYWAKKIDSNTIELYSDSGLSTIVDLTDTGSGTHTVYYGVVKASQIGVVSAVADSGNFTVTFIGEVTGLTGLTDGALYYLSASSAGAVSTSIPSGVGEYAMPVMVATSTTSAIVFPSVAAQLVEDSVRGEHVADKQIALSHLTATLQAQIQRNPSSMRQVVVAGRCASSASTVSGYDYTVGQANFLEVGTGLQATLAASTSVPVILSFANGSDGTNGFNYLETISSNQNFNSLTASSELFLYVDRDASGTLSYSFTNQPPEYGYARSVFRKRSLMPIFSSSTLDAAGNAHNVTVTASSESGSDLAWRVFDGATSTEWRTGTTTGAASLTVQLPYPKVVNRISLMVPADTNAPATFSLKASNTGAFAGEEVTLLSETHGAWTANVFDSFEMATPNTTAYTYYKLDVATTRGGSVVTRVSNLSLCEAIDHYYVIPEGVMYYTSNGGSSWTAKNRVFVGECRTSGAAVASIVAYALGGLYQYQSGQGQENVNAPSDDRLTAGTDKTKGHYLGVPGTQVAMRLFARRNEMFPWVELSGITYNGATRVGAQCTAGTKAASSRDDRLTATIVTVSGSNVLHDNNHTYGVRSGDNGVDNVDWRLIVSRAF